jgi:predicted ester cyclase
MLHYIYHVAFDAKAEVINTVITEDHALLEANIVGKHIGEFAGIPATNKQVNFPVCVCYDLENGLVKNARVYIVMDVLMKQLNS